MICRKGAQVAAQSEAQWERSPRQGLSLFPLFAFPRAHCSLGLERSRRTRTHDFISNSPRLFLKRHGPPVCKPVMALAGEKGYGYIFDGLRRYKREAGV